MSYAKLPISYIRCICLAGHLVGFNLVEKIFRKAFRILGLDERKGTWAVKQELRCSWTFSGQCYIIFCLFLRCP